MSKIWTSLDERNKFVGSVNILSAKCNELLLHMSTLTNYDVQLQNIGEVYRRKIFELSEELQKYGIDYFSKECFYTRSIIVSDLLTYISFAVQKLEQKIRFLEMFFMLHQISAFRAISKKAIKYFLKDYEEFIRQIESYDLEKNFAKSLMKKLYVSDYSYMVPNSYWQIWGSGVNTLCKIGQQAQVETLKPEALSLIEAQEKASLEYEQSWKNHK